MTDGFNECSVYCTIVYIYVCVCLVGSLEHFLFFHILGIIIPTDYFFRGVETTNQVCVCVCVVLFHPSYLVWWSQKTCSCSCSWSLSLSRICRPHIPKSRLPLKNPFKESLSPMDPSRNISNRYGIS